MPRRNHNADYHHVNWGAPPLIRRPTGLKIDAETIVREYRRHWEEPKEKDEAEVEVKKIQNSGLHSMPYYIPIRKMVNWGVAFEWLCWGLCIAALTMIAGLLIFGPTNWRAFLWR